MSISSLLYPSAQALLRRYGLGPKHSWGQNFLVNNDIFNTIVAATVEREDDWVIEVGAGVGTLTARLAERVPTGRVVAIERDRDMVKVLDGELGRVKNVEIAETTARGYDYSAVAVRAGGRAAVCGNLPYQLSSVILFDMLAHRANLRSMVLMLQREVAQRLTARPCTRVYSGLTAVVTAYVDVTSVVRVRPGSFFPAPKVESEVVKLVPLAEPRASIADEAHYAKVVRGAFARRRKTLRNSLHSIFAPEVVAEALRTTAIDGTRRGETLGVAEFAALADALPITAADRFKDKTGACDA